MKPKDLSPDAMYILYMLRKLLDLMDRKEREHPGRKFYLTRDNVQLFITNLEKKLGL